MTINEKLAKEKAKLEALEAKKADIELKIKTTKSTIAKLEMTQNNEQVQDMVAALKGNGLSLEEMVLAIKTGDFLGLQEKIEQAKTEKDSETNE